MHRSLAQDLSLVEMASSSNRSNTRRHTSSTASAHSSTIPGSASASTSSSGAATTSYHSSVSCSPPDSLNATLSPALSASSSTARDASSRPHVLSHINDIFKCTICFGRLEDPHLCPQCSKLYCYDCIGEWLDSGSSQSCPNCKTFLQLDQLVKVRWFDDIQKLQRSLRALTCGSEERDGKPGEESIVPASDLCPKHRKRVNFYCSTCEQCVCEVCATGGDGDAGQHRDHTFKALQVTYEQHVALLDGELEKVEHYRDKLSLLLDKIDRNVELIRRVKTVKHKELEAIMVAALNSLDRQEEQKLMKLRVHQFNLMTEIEEVNEKLQTMHYHMEFHSKPQLIQMKPKIVAACDAIRLLPIRDFKQIRVPASLKIEIPHLFETGVFVVQNFSTFDDNKVVYSNEFSDCMGRTWRIMAWCVISEDHFGIYLELVHGRPCWMECTFQLIHLEPEKTITKTIRQYFDRTPQKGWGLRDFVTLKTILEENYLRLNDSLELLYNIRPCSPTETDHALDADESSSEH
uniref:RING-type domain-containing protein n=1 Tax=Anopheles quadriannulatus TaxID=34691 RepID=A0A182WSB0_ANOQN